MSIVVAGATGQLGQLVVESLLQRGVVAEEITATGRAVDRIAGMRDRGVNVRVADFNDVPALDAVLAGCEVLVFISAGDVWARRPEHHNVVEAAVRAGVGRIVYTSIPKADRTPMLMAEEHRLTEEELALSGLEWTVLRNGWYIENYTRNLASYLERGMIGAAGNGLVSVAARKDYAEAAAVTATTQGHEGKVYELGGVPMTLTEIAGLISDVTGHEVTYTDVPEADLVRILVAAGVPEPIAKLFADVDSRIKAGDLFVDTGDLESLIGHDLSPLADVIRLAAAAL